MSRIDILEKIEEISNHFKKQLLSGNFKFIKCNEHIADIEIDGFDLQVWIANTPKDNFDFYESRFSSNVYFRSKVFKTQKERIKGYKMVKPFIEKYKKDVLKKQKISELKKLQKEIEKYEQD